MDENFEELFRSVEKSPSYWMQVALLEFLQSLAATRASRGVLSNKDLAKLVGVSPPTLSRWLNGNENITISTMCRLATALGAAVHIHVADNKKKGRWKEESGEVRAPNALDDRSVAARSPEPHAKLFNIRDYMPDVGGRRVNRKTLSEMPPISPELAESYG
jgi:transcriptional regulator with XRE-family HTH domain